MNILSQLEKTLSSIESYQAVSPEPILVEYIGKYKRAIADLKNDEGASIRYLLNCARGYLETSSRWDLPFLEEMGKTESLIKNRS